MQDSKIPLTLKFMDSKKVVELEVSGGIVTPYDLMTAINMAPEHSVHVSIVGVVKGEERHLFAKTDDLPFDHLPLTEEVFAPDSELTLLHVDDREDNVAKLTPEQLSALKLEFAELDADQGGTLSLTEISWKYNAEKNQKLNAIDDEFEPKLATAVVFQKKALEMRMGKEKKRVEEECQRQIDKMMAADIDGDGEISLKEYLIARAPFVRASQAAQSFQDLSSFM